MYLFLRIIVLCGSFSQGNGEATTAGMGTAKVARVAGAKAEGARRASQTEGEESDADY